MRADPTTTRDAPSQPGRRQPHLGRATALYAVFTGFSRIAGLAREILAAALFGTKGSINAFVIAAQLPNLLRNLVADSALSAAFVPIFTELEEQGRQRDAQRLAGALIGAVAFLLGMVSLIAVVCAPWVVPLLAPGLSEDLVSEAVTLAQIMFPVVVLLGLTGLMEAILQANGRFGAPAFGPVVWNLVVIGFLLAATRIADERLQIVAYAVGVLVGTGLQLLFLFPWLRGLGPFPISLGLRNRNVRRVLMLMLPVTLGLGLININFLVDGIFATLVSDEAPRAIDAAYRLYSLPQGVFSVAIATVLFPTISRQAARRDVEGLRTTLAGGVRQIVFMLLPASVFLLVLAEPVVRLIFQRGEFDASSTALTSEATLFFAIGLTFNGISLLLVRAFFALQRAWLPTQVALLGVALNATLDAAFYGPLGVGGIPLSTTISSAVTCMVLLVLLERELGGMHRRWVLEGSGLIVIASAVSALAAYVGWAVADDLFGRGPAGQLVSMAVAVTMGVLHYGAAARVLGIGELSAMSRLTRRD